MLTDQYPLQIVFIDQGDDLVAIDPIDLADALARLADEVGATGAASVQSLQRPELPSGDLKPATIGQAIAALLPENAIVVDESMTSGRGLMAATRGAAPHDWLGNTGGSIGIALPLAVGAAVASPTPTPNRLTIRKE